MFFSDHPPPHVHAYYGGGQATFGIEPARPLSGRLAPRAERLVLEWIELHERELGDNWNRARQHRPLDLVKPLD